MTVHWTFEVEWLAARNEVGALLGTWLVDEAMGRLLADMLNHVQHLNRLLLSTLRSENGEGARSVIVGSGDVG
jgi:hypothetical protein